MFDPNANSVVFNRMPLAVLIIISVVGAIGLFFQGAENGIIRGVDAVGLRASWGQTFGFRASIFESMYVAGNYPLDQLSRLLTFGFVQRTFTTAIVALAIFAALGKNVAERFGQICFLTIFFAAPIFGVASYVLLTGANGWIIGLFPAVFGMVGGFTVHQIEYRREQGETILPAFSLIAFFMTIQLVFFFIFGGTMEWIAEFFSFVAGFVIAYLFGWRGSDRRAEILRVLRRR